MRKRTRWAWVAAPILLAAFAIPFKTTGAAEPALTIELNKAEDTDESSCLAAFVLRNSMATALDRFSLDLYVFDSESIIARQLVIDLAPLRSDKTTVVRFPLLRQPCATISKVLINDIPSCRSAATGEDLDCLSVLSVSSRDRIGLTK